MALVTHGIVSLGSTRTALLFGIALLVGYAFEQVQQLPAVPSKRATNIGKCVHSPFVANRRSVLHLVGYSASTFMTLTSWA